MLTITVKATGGDDVGETIEQMCLLASRLGCIVSIDFNDVHLMAKPGCDPRDLHQGWIAATKSKRPYKIACAHPVQLPRAFETPTEGKKGDERG